MCEIILLHWRYSRRLENIWCQTVKAVGNFIKILINLPDDFSFRATWWLSDEHCRSSAKVTGSIPGCFVWVVLRCSCSTETHSPKGMHEMNWEVYIEE